MSKYHRFPWIAGTIPYTIANVKAATPAAVSVVIKIIFVVLPFWSSILTGGVPASRGRFGETLVGT